LKIKPYKFTALELPGKFSGFFFKTVVNNLKFKGFDMKGIQAFPFFHSRNQGCFVFFAFSGIGILLFLYKIPHLNF